jgi:hypothetical protein
MGAIIHLGFEETIRTGQIFRVTLKFEAKWRQQAGELPVTWVNSLVSGINQANYETR